MYIVCYFHKKIALTAIVTLQIYIVLFRGNSPSKLIFISINFFKVSIRFVENNIQRMYTINFYIFWVFYRNISIVGNNNIFVWLFVYFNIIWIKTFYIDNTIKKVECVTFYVYIFDFVTWDWFIFLIRNFL